MPSESSENGRIPPARLEAPARTRGDLAAFVEAMRLLAGTLDLREVLQRLSELARTWLGTDSVGIWLLDATSGESLLRAHVGMTRPEEIARFRVEQGKGLVGWIATHRAPLVLPDVLADPRPVSREWLKAEGFCSFLGVLLLTGDAPVGVLAVFSRTRRDFPPDEVALVEALAGVAAVAIRNAGLYADQVRSTAEARGLAEIAHVVGSSSNVKEILKEVCRQAALLCGADRGSVWFWEPEPASAVPVMSQFATGERNEALWSLLKEMKIRLPGEMAIVRLLGETRKPVAIVDARESDLIDRGLVETFQLKSVLAVPLFARDQAIGALILDTIEAVRPFTPRQLDLAVSIADHLALVTQKVLLFEDTERRLRQTEACLEIAHTLSSTLELKPLLKQIAVQAARACEMDRCSIFLLEEERVVPVTSQFADGRADQALWEAFEQMGRMDVHEISFFGEAIRRREPVVIHDPKDDPLVPPNMAVFQLKALLVVPLIRQEKVVGAMALDKTTERRPIREDQIRLAVIIASQVAFALDNARIYDEARARASALAALLDVSRELSQVQPLPSLLGRIAEACGRLLGTDSVGIRLVEGDELVIGGLWGDAKEAMSTPRIKVGESLTGIIAATGETLLVTDPANDPRLIPAHREAYRRLGVRAFLGVPVKVGDQVAGVLSIRTKRERGFSAQDVALATAFASQAAVALENARLYRRAEERAEKLTALSTLTRLITSSTDSQQVFHAVAEAAITLLGAKITRVWVEDPAGRVLRIRASFGLDTTLEHTKTDFPAIAYGQGLIGRLFESRAPEYIENVQEDSRWLNQRLAREVDLHAFAGIPLITGDQVVGILSILFGERRQFTPEEKELMSLLADQAAVAVENARLHEQAQRALADLKAAQDRLVQYEKFRALAEMAGGVAHDFNNLLTVILGRAQHLLPQLDEGKANVTQVRRSLTLIERASLDGAETVRRLLEFTSARPRPGAAVEVNVKDLLVQAVEASRHRWKDEAEAKGRQIQVVIEAGDLPPVTGNPAELREALLNLIFNGIDAMSEGGTLTLSSRAERDTVCLAVTDSGVGIPDEVRSRIFDPFFTTKGPQASGLGLSVSYGIVRRHGGEINVNSQPGRGTTFTVRLPIRAPQPARVEEASAGASSRLRILVIDDQAAVRKIFRDMLASAGHEVYEAGSGPEGLELLERQPVDVVCTDLGMPGMTGWEVADRIKARWPEIKVALITGWGDWVEPDELEAHGVDLLITKPVEMKELLNALSRLVGSRASPKTVP